MNSSNEDLKLEKREEARIKREDDKSKENALREISKLVSKSTPIMISSAIGAAIGSFMILKLEMSDRGTTRWVPIPEWNTEAIIDAVQQISEAMSEGKSWNETGYVMIQQRQPDVKALNTLLDRGFGKVAESVQINKNVTFSLADVGRKALESKKRAVGQIVENEEKIMIRGEVIRDIEEPLPSRLTPTSW